MYSQDEINSAVAAGALTQGAADALRDHAAQIRERPVMDEEHFRLVNSFNDIFVAIGIVILLVAAGAIGQAIGGAFVTVPEWPMADITEQKLARISSERESAEGLKMAISALLVALASWPLAEFFTGRRRMALPSIILLVAFVAGVFACAIGLARFTADMDQSLVGSLLVSFSGLIAAGAAWVHWRRFKVPITVAAGAAAAGVTIIALLLAIIESISEGASEFALLPLIFASGLVIFALAMRWDISDPTRSTRRADVAFWLHLLAAPMIAHPVFSATGVMDNSSGVGIGGAIAVLAIYIVFGLVALAIDRRALLVSALAYVLAALAFLFDSFGAVELTFALTALVIGSALLTLSAYWSPIRRKIVSGLPENLQAKLPASTPVAA